ncbi:hypothetical protein NC653_001290 [Populus alba x Populus x berolinensis]|uniref:K-box domain-containing protein n=1 Tax=Populus alba x Populus x berolinensis TaxID=444605 RepID=A0AAD6RLQ1_9ROSI|nr:hypothetical protein NC653_001290 [Populus alba x Populus x berolinensis]
MSLYGTILDLSLALYGLRVWWCPSFTCYPALEAFKNLSERNWQPTGMLTVSQFTLGGCPFIGYREWEVVSHTLCQVSLHDSMVSVFFLNLPKKERDQVLDGALSLFMNRTIERYQKRAKDVGISSRMVKDNMQPVKEDAFTLAKKIDILEVSKRKLLGDGLEPCSIDELQQLENQLERSLTRIRARKNQLFREQIEKLKGECGMQPLDLSATKTPQVLQDRQIIEVETELFIGPPDSRDTACPQNHKS